jgi:hypothetical protein
MGKKVVVLLVLMTAEWTVEKMVCVEAAQLV